MTRFLVYIGAAAACFVLFSSIALAQADRATVAGTITDQGGALVVSAEIQILNLASGQLRQTMTDSSGRYELGGLPLGSYRLSVISKGFAVGARGIILRDYRTYTEDFSLTPGIIESSITVTPGKGSARLADETPQNVTVIHQSLIEAQRPSSTLRAIERAPNLTPVIANSALERPRLRGLASNRLL
ncbi:MAG TPA: carboxypeptidase regulatory-like domain-containing protein, partial [Pyrinomonadaceae bacterium]|nr:carboxypeptidase regulatory-like domain-containing protein [Pyrinomonadaceae bacterium]